MTYTFTSTWSAMVANGRAADAATPWRVIIDTDAQTITVAKRNRTFIGVDEDTLAFRFIRRVKIDAHVIGADITISAVGGDLTAYCLDKKDCKRIKEILMEFNRNSDNGCIVFG